MKKYRKLHQAFLVEGAKSVQELLSSDFQITIVFTTKEFYNENIRQLSTQSFECEIVTGEELEKTGIFQSNNACLAVAVPKPNQPLFIQPTEYVLVLDEIKDPGNLGTIIRIADWYGIYKIICSETTTDLYNPKVIAASMGSFTRVKLYYCNLYEYFKNTSQFQVYGAFLEGKDVHTIPFTSSGLIVLGNESKGINPELVPLIHHKIHIPRYGGAESLNVGIATAVICDNLRRVVSSK